MIYSRKYPHLHKRHLSHIEPGIKLATTEPIQVQEEQQEQFDEQFATESEPSEYVPSVNPDEDEVKPPVKKSTKKKT